MKNISTMKNTSFRLSTSVQRLRRVAIFAAVLVMSMANIGTMWGTARTFKSGEKIYFKDTWKASGNSSTWKTSADGTTLCAYFYGDGDGWYKCYGSDNVYGNWNEANTIYQITVPGEGKNFTHVVFTRGKNDPYAYDKWANCWNKTMPQAPDESYNIFYVNNSTTWDDNENKYNGSWGRYAHNGALVGEFNDWNPDTYPLSNSGVKGVLVPLEASTTYKFKILLGETYYGINSASTITATLTSWWTFYSGQGDVPIQTDVAGDYGFAWNASSKNVTVYYPKALYPKSQYIYFDVRNETYWNANAFTARFYLKYFDSGSNLEGMPLECSSPLEDYIYYVQVPDNGYIGQIQMNRWYNSAVDGVANIAYVYNRSSASENCLKEETGKTNYKDSWTPQWATYCPPMSSSSLSDNSTTVISWTSGDGSSGNPYLVKTGTSIKVTASATSAVADANMTKKFDFKVNSTSEQDGTGSTFSYTASTNNTLYTVTVDAYNYYNSTSSTKSTPSAKYYKALNTYTVTNSLTNMSSDGRSGTDAAAYGIAYTATLSASTGYNLPATITVVCGETTLTAGTHYTYNSSTGALSINAAQVSGNITITAAGVAKTYTADNNLDKNSGDSHGKYTATFDATSIAINTTPAKTGYDVDGYYGESGLTNRVADADGALKASVTVSEVVYTDSNGKWKKDGNVTLYTKWTANNYTITLNANGGSDGTESVTATYNSSSLSASITNPELTGYTFSGWYSGDNGTGDLVINTSGALQANTCYTGASGIWAAGNVTLYAKWTANTYTITLDDNGGSADGSAVVRYDSIAVRPASLSHATHASLTLLGYYTHVIGGTKVLNADGSFAATNIAGYVTSGKWTKASDCTLYAHWGNVISPSSEILYRAKDKDATQYNEGYPKSADANETFELNWKARMAAVHQYAIPNFTSAKTITLVLPVKTENSNSLKVWNFPYEATTTTDASDFFANVQTAAGISILTNDGTAFGTALATASASGGAWALKFDASTLKPYSYDGTTAYVNLLISTATSDNAKRSDYYTGKAGNASTPYVQVEYFDEGNPVHEYNYRFKYESSQIKWESGFPKTEVGNTNWETQIYNKFFSIEEFVVTDFNIRNVYTLTLTVAESKGGTMSVFDYPYAHTADGATAGGYVQTVTGATLSADHPTTSETPIQAVSDATGKWTFTIPADQLTPIYQDEHKTVFCLLVTGANSTAQVRYCTSSHTTAADRPTLALNHVRYTRIGKSYYADLNAAHTAAETHDTIYICDDYTQSTQVTITKSVTITSEPDHKYTITRGSACNQFFIKIQNADTIQNLIFAGAEGDKKYGHEPFELVNGSSGEFAVAFNNVTFSKFGYDENNNHGIVAVLDNAKVTFTDVVFDDCHIADGKVAGDIFIRGGSAGKNITFAGTIDAPEGVYLNLNKRIVNSSATYTHTVPLLLANDYGHNYAAVTVLPEANATDFSISNTGWYTKWVNVNGGEIHAMHGTRLTFDKNGGDADGSAEARTDSTTLVNITHATRTGYTLTGYFTADEDGDKIVKADGTLPDEKVEDYINAEGKWIYDKNVDLTLYAQWTANTYTITYKDCGGGDFSGSQTDAPTAHTYGTATTLKTATKAGTTFLGWYDNVACTGSAISSLGATAYTADITLYAKWTTTLYDSYFYQTYNYDNTSTEDLISNAGLPFYINTTCDNRGWSALSAASPVTMPHDFSILNRSHTWYYLRGNKAITLTAVADVKAVHFYLWSTNTDRKITTTAKMVSGTGDDLSISDVTLSYGNDGTVREYVVNISSATGYSASNYYDYTFTFANGESWLWGIYVEKYTHVYPTAITIDKSSTTLVEGETQTLSLTSITPDNTTVKTATWSVTSDSPAGCVTVNSTTGVVTAVSAGTATVRASVDGQTADCAVTVETCESFHGTLYSIEPTMEHNTGSDIAVGQKDNYSAYADIQRGGRIWIGNGSASAISKTDWCFYSQNDDVQVQMWSNGGYVILNLDCALRNGDTIKYVEGYNTSGNLFNGNIAITTTATRSTTYCTDGNHKYVVTDGDGLDGKDSIYLWQGTNRSAFRSLSVMRPASYILTYDANGGTGAPDAERRICTSKALSSTLPTRDGYVFKEWNTSSTGNGDSYRAGASYTMPSANTTLYAIWVEPIHQNDFYPLYATTDVGGDGDESDDKKAARATALISAADLPSYIDVGFNRAYWYSISASTIDVPEDFTGSGKRSYLYSTSGHNTITLTAANVKAVRFYGWNGSSTGTLSTTASVVCGVGTAPTYSNVTTSGTNIVVAEHTVDIAGAANYNANTLYTFTFTFSGGSWLGMYVETNDTRTLTYSAADADDNVPDAETWAPNATDHLSSTEPNRTGYTFAGWNTLSTGLGDNYDAGAVYTMPLTNTTLYAKWTANEYEVTLDLNGGTAGDESVTATYDAALPSFTLATKTGYTLTGYYTASSDGTQVIDENGDLVADVDGYTDEDGKWILANDAELYAQWTINNHDITYTAPSHGTYTIKAGDASAVSEDIADVDYGTTITLTATPSSCYEFSTWTVTGATPADASAATTTFSMPDNDVTVAATFAARTYPITYYDADTTAIDTLSPKTYVYNAGDVILPTVLTTKTGYTFNGWLKYGADRRIRTKIDNGSSGNYKFIATWKQTLTLNMQGVGSSPVATVMYDSTSLASYTPGATFRDGVLLGYYTDATDGTKVLNADGTFAATNVTDYIVGGRWRKAGATTLYAHWNATISLPDTLRKSNYVAYGGNLTFIDDTLAYATGATGYAEWQVDMVQALYNVTIKGHYNYGHSWQLGLINSSGVVDSTCTFAKTYDKEDRTENKTWSLASISEGVYTIRVMNLVSGGDPKLLNVVLDPITVTYDANGGSCATERVVYKGSALTLPSASKSGYVLEGWFSGNTKIGNAGGSYEPTASITLTAKWGQIINIPDTLTKENVGDYSSDMTWYNTDYFDFGPTDAANLGRWAKWEVNVVPCEYTVTVAGYYPNVHQWQLVLTDGSTKDTLQLASVSSTGERTESTTWDLTGISKGVYTLEVKNIYGWSQPKLKSVALTAQTYTISYAAGTYGSGSLASGKKIKCQSYTLSSSDDAFTRAGYAYDGWSTNEDGSTKNYNLGATYSTDADLTLYPHWICATPPDPTGFTAGTITDGGVTFTITDDADAASYDIYYSTSSTAPTGSTDATTTSTSKTKAVTGLSAGTTYYAWVRAVCDGSHKSAWVALTGSTFFTNYSITMGTVTTNQPEGSTVGGTISASPTSAAEDATVTLTATPTSGYGFVSWKIEKTSDNSDITSDVLDGNTLTMPAYGVTVKATFAKQYSIAYKEADGSTTIDLTPTSYLYGIGVPSLPTPPAKTGYTFANWYNSWCVNTKHSGTWDDECITTSIGTSDHGSATYLAKYTPNEYTITLNGNGGTGNTTSVTATYNSATLPEFTNPTRTCYTFAGWNTKSDGSGDDVIGTDGKLNTSITGYTDGEGDWIAVTDTTLYARWTQDNLALNKTPVAGYTPSNPDEAPAKLTDGSTSTAWTTYNEQDASVEWFYVDLGAVYQLSSIEAVWGEVYSTDYILQTSHSAPANSSAAADDSKWYTVAEVTDATGSATKTTSIDVAARYVRLHSLTRSGGFLRLYEFRVFGTGAADKDDTAPVINTATFKTASTGQNAAQFDVTFTEAVTAAADIHWTVVDKNSVSHAATYSDGVLSVTGLPTDANQSVTIYGMDEAANISDGKEVSDISYLNPTENLALNKTSYACIDYNDSEGKEQANDGDTDTYMTTFTYATESNEWWYVDLGAFFDIHRIEVVWMENYASASYSVQYRQNAPAGDSGATSSEWDAISEFTTVTTGDKSADIASSVSARYICLRSTSHGSTHTEQNRLAEVRVFGSAFGTPDEDAPVWTDAQCAVTSAENHTIKMTLEATDENPANIYKFYINVDNGTTSKDYECSTAALSNVITITDASFIDACETYTVTAKCYDHVGNEATKVFSGVETVVANHTNLALGKTTSAGISEGGDNGANAVDGNYENQWSGNTDGKAGGVNQWIIVDLGKTYNIDSIKITWGNQEGSWPQDYEIQVSYNGTDYRSIKHRSKDNNRTVKYTFSSAKGHYVRVWAEQYGTDYGMCITELEVYGGCYTDDDGIYEFTGQGATSTAWSTAANWTKGAVPSATDTVRILAPVVVPAEYTAHAAKVIIATGGAEASGTATASGKLTIASGGALIVTDSIKRCADAGSIYTLTVTRPEDLKIESSIDDGNGTLIFTNTGDSATVELYCKASTEAIPWTWQYVGVPFTTADPQAAFWGGYMYYWPTDASGWKSVTKSTTLSAFTGYSLSYTEAGHVFSMEGQLAATTSKDIAVPAGKDMVVGNSWTAPIQIKQLRDADFTNLLKNVYFYNTGNDSTKEAGQWSVDHYDPGTYVTVPIHASPYTGDSVISALQGFFVTNTSGSAGTLHLSYADHVRPAGSTSVINGQMHAPRRVNMEEQPVVLKIWATGSEYTDRVVLLEREDFSEGLDDGWDGDKWINPECTKSPLIYAVRTDGTKDAVSALPELDGTVISFRAGEDKDYTLRFEYAEDNEELYIYDVEKNEYTQIVGGATYPFTDTNTEAHARFLLTRNKAPQITTGEKPTSDSSLKGRATKLLLEQKLYIYRNGVLYDATGRRVESEEKGGAE